MTQSFFTKNNKKRQIGIENTNVAQTYQGCHFLTRSAIYRQYYFDSISGVNALCQQVQAYSSLQCKGPCGAHNQNGYKTCSLLLLLLPAANPSVVNLKDKHN